MPLRTRQLIPPLTMRTAEGRVVHAWDFKQKKNLVIAFLDASCAPCEEFLAQIVQRASDVAAHNAVALVAFLEYPRSSFAESLPPNIIVGVDVSGRSARAFLGGDEPSRGSDAPAPGACAPSRAVFVTDRYGELAALWLLAQAQHNFPTLEAILTALGGIEITCEECAPHWSADT
jgi:AhpC/TSA family